MDPDIKRFSKQNSCNNMTKITLSQGDKTDD